MLISTRVVLVCLLAGAVSASFPVRAESDSSAARACHAGEKARSLTAASAGGSMPLKLEGVTTVSPQEAHCLIEKLGGRLAVIQAMEDEHRLPGAVEIPELGLSRLSDAQVAYGNAKAEKSLGRDPSRPVLVYCHHSSCPLSVMAAKRLHEGKFTTIYWMREGIEGWQQAGYAFAKDKGRLSARYQEAVGKCDDALRSAPWSYVLAVENGKDVEREFADSLKSDQTPRDTCLRKVRGQFTDNPAVLADVDGRLSRSDADLKRAYASARSKVEADPASYFLQDVKLEELRETLTKARSMRTFAQACGTVDASVPSVESDADAFEAAQRRHKAYQACYNKLLEQTEGGFFQGNFLDVATAVSATKRYTCSNRGSPNCLPDAAWRRVAEVASPVNAALVENARQAWLGRDEDLNNARAAIEAFHRRLNARIDAHNAWAEAQDRRAPSYSAPSYTYSSPAYTPPPPPVYQPMPTHIYEGVK